MTSFLNKKNIEGAGSQGPQGTQGTQGTQGIAGAQGSQGAQGAAGGGINISRPALDGYHIHVYNCDDVAGSITLADSGSGNKAATLYGTEGTGYTIGTSYTAGRTVSSLRSLQKANASITSVAATDNTCNIAGGKITVECVVRHGDVLDSYKGQFFVTLVGASNTDYAYLSTHSVSGAYLFQVSIGGTSYYTSYQLTWLQTPQQGALVHLMGVYDKDQAAGSRVKLYINGILVAWDGQNSAQYPGSGAQNINPTSPLATMKKIYIGGYQSGNYSPECNIRDVRVSNIARPASYAISTAEALLAM